MPKLNPIIVCTPTNISAIQCIDTLIMFCVGNVQVMCFHLSSAINLNNDDWYIRTLSNDWFGQW